MKRSNAYVFIGSIYYSDESVSLLEVMEQVGQCILSLS